MSSEWNHKIFSVQPDSFVSLSLQVFRFQYDNNPVYRAFVDALKVNPATVKELASIPFLPISLFRTSKVITTPFEAELVFESSGTTGAATSRHYVREKELYEQSFMRGFNACYGPVIEWCIIGLLPGYLERQNSSLVYMVNKLIGEGGHADSGFYLQEHEKLESVLKSRERAQQKTLLIGVSFALLDFAAKYRLDLMHTIVMETGGMKGRGKELIREELHAILQQSFGVPSIHSEYGMTELLSQAYSKGKGLFTSPPWMRAMIRDEEDPLRITGSGTGALNIIDLANIYSCSFIATDDAGRVFSNGQFEVLGRMDGSDLRGCSLLV